MAITSTLNSLLQFIGYGLPPVGSIEMFASNSIPSGWLLCNGAAVSRTTYPKLFATIGTTYGSGNGSTTFNLPNFQGRVPLGKGNSGTAGSTSHDLGEALGEEKHKLLANELPKISGRFHARSIQRSDGTPYSIVTNVDGTIFQRTAGGDESSVKGGSNQGNVGGTTVTMAFGNDDYHNNLPPYVTVNYIIRAT